MREEKILLSLFGEGESMGEGAGDVAAETEQSSGRNEKGTFSSEQKGTRDEGEAFERALRSRIVRAHLSEKLRARRAAKEYDSLMAEASALLSENSDFDLKTSLSDRRFTAMIRSGLSVREAYRALHADELLEKAREEAKNEALASALAEIRKQSQRPSENGSGNTAPEGSYSGVEHLSGKGIRDILKRVEKGAKIKF
ncbi:MAG: hypothetical protein IKL24_04425 [Clostridia bacterium]|nr:hypothetical protein [Clostridia bacterium]